MRAPRRVEVVHDHPGSSSQEIADEPDWGTGHQHRIGFRNRQGRVAGFTHDLDLPDPQERKEDEEFIEDAMRKYQELRQRTKKGDLIKFSGPDERSDRFPEASTEGVPARF